MAQSFLRCYSIFAHSAIGCTFNEYLSDLCCIQETLYQRASDGTSFVDCLAERGVLPGIKVDEVWTPQILASELA